MVRVSDDFVWIGGSCEGLWFCVVHDETPEAGLPA
jgi:hypothetical protein